MANSTHTQDSAPKQEQPKTGAAVEPAAPVTAPGLAQRALQFPRSLNPPQLLQLQRAVGNQATRRLLGQGQQQDQQTLPLPRGPVLKRSLLQRAPIDPAMFFDESREDEEIDASIDSDELTGFGATVNGTEWHTKLTFDPLVTPGAVGPNQMQPEGSGVTGVIGPDHAYGSQPSSVTAFQNNATAGAIRGWNPHGHVAAHIVNDQLGGPGIQQNLFALPGNANTLMETQVESKMKEAVEVGNFIYYRAQVNHPPNGPADSITMSWNKLDEDGNDIGGGQTNVRIDADNTAHNTDVDALGGGIQARRGTLLPAKNLTEIGWSPWGPFQMPDPKQIIALRPYLDFSKFPAVGNARAFEHFLTNNRNVPLRMDMMWLHLDDLTVLTNIANWIRSKSGIAIKSRRGITNSLLSSLKSGTTGQRQQALLDILDTGDGRRVIPFAAKELAKVARRTARSRV